jgi:Beta protein
MEFCCRLDDRRVLLAAVPLHECGHARRNPLVREFGADKPTPALLLRIAKRPRRTVTLLSGAFPINLSHISPGLALAPRSDWALWQGVNASRPVRRPSFGDYTAAHPDQHLQEIDPRFMQVSASIRYATDDDWLIVRGRSTRNPRFGGTAQYQELSRVLIAQPQFTATVSLGRAHSLRSVQQINIGAIQRRGGRLRQTGTWF